MRRVEGNGGQLPGALGLRAGGVQQSRLRAEVVQPAKADAVMPIPRAASRSLRRRRERSKMLSLTIGILVALACLAGLSRQFVSLISSPNQPAAVNAELERIGKIVVQDGLNDCKQKKFDNQSGRISDDASPCDDRIVLDAHGVPVPVGTIQRLDAISKSFSAH